MSKTSWRGGNGDWGTVSLWTHGVPDTATSDATIGAAGVYTVAIAAGAVIWA